MDVVARALELLIYKSARGTPTRPLLTRELAAFFSKKCASVLTPGHVPACFHPSTAHPFSKTFARHGCALPHQAQHHSPAPVLVLRAGHALSGVGKPCKPRVGSVPVPKAVVLLHRRCWLPFHHGVCVCVCVCNHKRMSVSTCIYCLFRQMRVHALPVSCALSLPLSLTHTTPHQSSPRNTYIHTYIYHTYIKTHRHPTART